MSNDPLIANLLAQLPERSHFLDEFRPPKAVAISPEVTELRQRIENVRRRFREGPEAPMRVAFFGPTGAGKSKLFGSLIGDNFSGSGFKRPFTRTSFYYLHDDWRALSKSLAQVGEVCLHENEDWRDVVLIDTPDFDSVEDKNRVEAERVFLECDGFLFVTDALKYADASTWEYLERIRESEKAFAVIQNKVVTSAVAEGFRERFVHTFGKDAHYEAVEVPEFRIDDTQLIDSGHESMKKLAAIAKKLVSGEKEGAHVRSELLSLECNGVCEQAKKLSGRIQVIRREVDSAKAELSRRALAAKQRLDARLESGIEASVRDDVYNDVMRRLEKIDLLSYPRKLLSMPVMGLKALVTSWLPGSQSEKTAQPKEPAFADPISSETFHLLESEMISYADQSRNDIVARSGLESLIDRETFKQLRYSHDELQQMYIEHHQRFSRWVAGNAEETASEITTENRAKFVLSQVLFNTVLLSSQVAWGGFSPLDLAADSVISPVVAKGVSMMIGNEKVKQFEEMAHAEHQRSLGEIFDRVRNRFEDFLEESCGGLGPLESQLAELLVIQEHIPGIIRHFEGLDRESPTLDSNVEAPATASGIGSDEEGEPKS